MPLVPLHSRHDIKCAFRDTGAFMDKMISISALKTNHTFATDRNAAKQAMQSPMTLIFNEVHFAVDAK